MRRRQKGAGAGRWFLLGFLFLLLCGGLVAASAVGWVYRTASSAPPLSSLKQKNPGSLTEVLAADGTRLGFIQNDDLVTPVPANDMPKVLQEATVPNRGQALLQAHGLGLQGIIRAAVKNATEHKT